MVELVVVWCRRFVSMLKGSLLNVSPVYINGVYLYATLHQMEHVLCLLQNTLTVTLNCKVNSQLLFTSS